LVIHGDEAEGSYLSVLDAEPSSKTFMTEIGYYQSRANTSIHNVRASGARAYVTHYQDGVRIIDLADPTCPVLAAHFNTWRPGNQAGDNTLFAGAIGIDVDRVRYLLFVVDNPCGVLIFSDETTR